MHLFHRYPRFATAQQFNMAPNRFNYPPMRDPNEGLPPQNVMRPYNSIASVFEEVQAKVGVG